LWLLGLLVFIMGGFHGNQEEIAILKWHRSNLTRHAKKRAPVWIYKNRVYAQVYEWVFYKVEHMTFKNKGIIFWLSIIYATPPPYTTPFATNLWIIIPGPIYRPQSVTRTNLTYLKTYTMYLSEILCTCITPPWLCWG
jgi:hypothetical protein